ncbi:hypothetical protein [Streptomyces fulvorobeus]|uniref:Uncharacterized protein n=1 Tax=Streptomyces fulvorobeus TaxID=284028 RepID=A0A7Y9KZ76_9ACTN|nr:hypothetical protein [Streptomyces fulvorobeus]NYE44789.1 hypothetical protein [Streptomyces fulvorobeus]
MSDTSSDASWPQPSVPEDESGPGGWLRRRRPEGQPPQPAHDTPDERSRAPLTGPAGLVDPHPNAPNLLRIDGASTHLHGEVGVVANVVEELNLQTNTHKRDVLEGVEIDRGQLLDQPFVRGPHWDAAWTQALDTVSGRPQQPVLVIVAPRSFGSTTFALRLLAQHTASHVDLVKLDADWSTPTKGRLPLEKEHAFQLDLKHPENDQLSSDFLNALSSHASQLRANGSYLVLTVAQELWRDHRLGKREGVHVVHLREAPDAQKVVEAHLEAYGYERLITALRSYSKAQASLRGLTAVAAERAAHTIVMVWQEHSHLEQSPISAHLGEQPPMSLEDRLTAALTDWRSELDALFGEMTRLHSHGNPSLTVEDRCLLLALAVQQSAPMPDVARSAQELLTRAAGQTSAPSGAGGAFAAAPSALAGRGLRRRILDVGAGVDGQDKVVFDRPAYGRAVLEYVWDNYDTMREPLLAWLVEAAQTPSLEDPTVSALAELTLRHGTMGYLTTLGKTACAKKPEVLGAVMESAVRNEHIGRLAWEVLYRWAEQDEYAPAVIVLCRRILEDTTVAPSTAKRAMVRLRRIAHTTGERATRELVLAAYTDLAERPVGAARLTSEVREWQQSKGSARGGSLAFLALMAAQDDGAPWLLTQSSLDIDVSRAVHDLLGNPRTVAEIIPRLSTWIRASTTDPVAYGRLRDQLLPALRGHNMFEAGMNLMRELRGISTAEGTSVADDFYHHLVDPRLHPVFPLQDGA